MPTAPKRLPTRAKSETPTDSPKDPMPSRAEVMEAQKKVPAGTLSEAAQLRIAEAKNQSRMVAEMAGTTWGKGLSPAALGALARYLRINKLDVNDIDVLGGRLYRNSHYYKRRLSDMIGDELVEYAIADHVAVDPRLDDLASMTPEEGDGSEELRAHIAWAKKEKARRLQERVAHAIPDNAIAACVFRVKLKAMPEEFAASKFIVPNRQKKKTVWRGGQKTNEKEEVQADPIGDEFPVESVESRACRRCMAFMASSIPALKWREDELTARAELVSDAIAQGRSSAIADLGTAPPQPVLIPGTDSDPYGLETGAPPAATKALTPGGPHTGPISDPAEEEGDGEPPVGGRPPDDDDEFIDDRDLND